MFGGKILFERFQIVKNGITIFEGVLVVSIEVKVFVKGDTKVFLL